MEIEYLNRLNKAKFKEISPKEKAIFLPQCLRNPDCKAKTTEEGIICLGCDKCNISKFKSEVEALGYKFFIVPGFSLTKRLIEKHKPKAVLGVACSGELKEAIATIKGSRIITQSLQLLKDGCVSTEVDWKKLREMIN